MEKEVKKMSEITKIELSPAVKALSVAKRVTQLLCELPKLKKGAIENIVIPDDLKETVKVILSQNPPKNVFLMGDTLYYSEHPAVGELRGLVEVLSERVSLCGGVVTIKMDPRGDCDDAEIAINPTKNTIVLRAEGTEMRGSENDEDEIIFSDLSSEEKYEVRYEDGLAFVEEVEEDE